MGNLAVFISNLLNSPWLLAPGKIDPTIVGSVVTAFGFFSGFLTYILASIVSRKAYIGLQRRVAGFIGLQWLSVFLGIMDLVTSEIDVFGWANVLFKLAIVVWATSLFALFVYMERVISIDSIKFQKPAVPTSGLESFQASDWSSVQDFGITCVKRYLDRATKEKQRLYFPILLIAEKHFRPWRICSRFAAAGLKNGESVIYFAFNQPPAVVTDQLVRQITFLDEKKRERKESNPNSKARSQTSWKRDKKSGESFSRLYFIDCYSSWIGTNFSPSTTLQVKDLLDFIQTYPCDPRDVVALGSVYKKALAKALHDGAKRVRVVYDSISDFLQYGDPQLAMQFIKHNMVWEDQNKVNSLYLYIPKVPQSNPSNPVDIEFLRWNAYCVIEFKHDEKHNNKDHMFVDNLFSARKKCDILMQTNGDYVVKREPSKKR